MRGGQAVSAPQGDVAHGEWLDSMRSVPVAHISSERRAQKALQPGSHAREPGRRVLHSYLVRIARISSAVSVGVFPTFTPAASRASFLA